MINLTCARIARKNPNIRRVGLLASTAVIRTALYRDHFSRYGVEAITPFEAFQDKLLSTIREIKSGNFDPGSLNFLATVSNEMIDHGAER
jgi:aspartate racemase